MAQLRFAGQASPSFEAETVALVAAMAVVPPGWLKVALNSFYIAVKASNLLTKLDRLHVTCMHTKQASYLDLINPTHTLADATGVVNLDKFFSINLPGGPGPSSDYIATDFNPVSGSPQYTQNAAAFGMWSLFPTQSGGAAIYAASAGNGSYFYPMLYDFLMYARINQATDITFAAPDGSGHWAIVRTSSTAVSIRRNGIEITTSAIASSALYNTTWKLSGAGSTDSWDGGIAAFWVGKLTTAEADLLYAALAPLIHTLSGAVYDKIVATTSPGDGTELQRIPCVEMLSSSTAMIMWHQRKSGVGGADGNAIRISQATLTIGAATPTAADTRITVGASAVFQQPTQWTGSPGAGFNGHIHMKKLALGAQAGRLIAVFGINEHPSGLVENYFGFWNIWQAHSDNNGATWSTPVRKADCTNFVGGIYHNAVSPGSNGDFIEIPSGPYAGRLVVPIYTNGVDRQGSMYSDDQGVTWLASAVINVIGSTGEPTIAWCPNGVLVMTIRHPTTRWRSFSIDGGASWTPPTVITGFPASVDCNMSTIQASPGGVGYGQIICASPTNLGPTVGVYRDGFKLIRTFDAFETWQMATLTPQPQITGYNSLRMFSSHELLLGYESSHNQNFNTTCTMRVRVIDLNTVRWQ